MAQPFDITNPPDTQALKLGALRMREMKTILNNTIGLLYTLSTSDSIAASVSEVANSVSGTMLAQHASDNSARAVGTNHIKNDAVTRTKLSSSASDDSVRAVGNDHVQNLSLNLGKLAQSSAATGDTIRWNGSAWAKVTPDIDVVSGATISTTGVVSTASGTGTLDVNAHPITHNLGAIPKFVRAVAVLGTPSGTEAAAGYASGDEVEIRSFIFAISGDNYHPVNVVSDATTITVSFLSTPFNRIIPKAGGAAVAITATNWTVKVYAWK
jgi:hypothetical protein